MQMIRQDHGSLDFERMPHLNGFYRLAQQRYGLLVGEDFPAAAGDHGEEEGATWGFGTAVFHR
jgi:hypothetical protein